MPDAPVEVDFFVIGTPKSASNWLCQCLDEHPRLSIGRPYEKRFLTEKRGWFDYEDNPRYLDDWDWYRDRFPDREEDQLRGDGSVGLYYNESGPEVVREWYPDAKLIAILRDPVDRIHSAYWHVKRTEDRDPGTLEEFVEDSIVVDQSRYATHLERWFETVPDDRLRVHPWVDLGEEGRGILRDVYGFLGVEENFEPPSLARRVNPARREKGWFRPLERVAEGLRSVGLGGIVDLANRWGIGPALRDKSADRIEKPPIDPSLERRLRKELEPEIEALEDRLGRDLGAWKG